MTRRNYQIITLDENTVVEKMVDKMASDKMTVDEKWWRQSCKIFAAGKTETI